MKRTVQDKPGTKTAPATPPAPAEHYELPAGTLQTRTELLDALAMMPDEAFFWLVTSIAGYVGRGAVWPDELGGFMEPSRKYIQAAQSAARKLCKDDGTK